MDEVIVILAGGLATRLRPITEKIPKSMILFHGKPFIYYQLKLLKEKGFKNILICAGYLGDKIKDFLDNNSNLGLSIKYSFDGDKLLGTGGALFKAKDLLSELFFVLYGDSYLNIDYKKILDLFYNKNCLGLMTIYKNNNKWDKSNVIYENNMIKLYDKKEELPEMNYIDYGLSLLNKKALDFIKSQTEYYDLGDLFNLLSKQNKLLGFNINNRFYEIGSLEGIKDFYKYLNKYERRGNE